ncbi:S-adenosyl-L-methionine-dependent methyltransferase [Clathrospora elynae]|uniref:Protein-lysine N-methyltransferase EFM4 n=1 Tax=Clathrospora elynae TaxID=706981 RepID=A0A6A5S7Q9_9PLEO|nr:S-adenosyl-L-methionine-dependent methyltransferase [Clathrospora elynae]
MTAPTHLDPSELGTKSYWDAAYTTERQNFAANTDDEGTIWFSDAGAEERMLAFLDDLSDEGHLNKGDAAVENTHEESREKEGAEERQNSTRFLDLGTGNGHLLFALREEAWHGELVGVDYSAQSITLATSIRDAKDTSFSDIAFHEWDILSQPPGTWLASGFDVVLDKGTFDAICLSQDMDAQGRRICEGYRERVEPLVKKGGRFLITSCNWTEEELRGWFGGGELAFEGKVRYPSFTFGGKSGSSVVTLCFRRG